MKRRLPPPEGQLRKVFPEEEYTGVLSQIVRRDFFPELTELEHQSALLEATSQSERAEIRRLARKKKEEDENLARQEKEAEHDIDASSCRNHSRPLHHENLTGFHQRVSSEDNHEFDSNQKKEIKEHRDVLERILRPQEAAALPQLELASDDFQPELNRIQAANWSKPAVKNSLFFVPTPTSQSRTGAHDCSTRLLLEESKPPASIQSENVSSLMPPPPSKSKKAKNTDVKKSLVEFIPKSSLEMKIDPSQTRFSVKAITPYRSGISVARSDSESAFDSSATDVSTDLDAPSNSIARDRQDYTKSNARQRRHYVNMTPVIDPGSGNESPITTWGTVDSTPLIISGQEHQTAFLLPSPTKREDAAKRAEGELLRRSKMTKAPKKTLDRSGLTSLTPAAQSLLEKTRGSSAFRKNDMFTSSLRSSYTPKSGHRPSSSSRKRTSDHAFSATPVRK